MLDKKKTHKKYTLQYTDKNNHKKNCKKKTKKNATHAFCSNKKKGEQIKKNTTIGHVFFEFILSLLKVSSIKRDL